MTPGKPDPARTPDTTLPAGPSAPVPALRAAPPGPDPSSPRRRRWLWAAAGGLALALAVVGYVQPWGGGPVSVAVEMAALAPVTRVLAVNGRIEAVHSVDVQPVIGGPLETLAVAEGDDVAAGQVLGRIDAAEQRAVLRQRVAALDAALVAQDQAIQIYNRSLSLGGNVARIVPEDDARAVQSAAQEVARLGALVDQAQITLENHVIHAPIAGTVLVLNVDQGQAVTPSTVLLTLADLGDLVVETDVDETYATQIARGQPAVLQLSGETGTRAGHVSFVSARVDVATGGLAVKIAFDDPVTAPVGLTVTTNIVVDSREAALSVPRTAIVTGQGGTAVFVAEDGIARLRPVTVVDWPAARLIVTAGLAPGDAVIAEATGLADGQPVNAGRR